ncbi:hypothetical protein [Candidatus Synechococcus spongiarum]|uniref:hypothetical protein n=1 Tax=Candidatus Synechococcus spongiarum TaxID=431041 RepID=UPI0012691F24|nr:hypothetical protein [Candidatus Synechococcus spongiarum]
MAAPGVLFAGAAIAGPFGFDLKSSVEPSRLYSFCEEGDGGHWNYECTTAPKPHPDMDTYLLHFVKGVGVCGVRSAITDIYTDSSGSILRNKTDSIANQIKLKYGQWSIKIDELEGNSFDSPLFWTYSLSEGLRDYDYYWGSSGLSAAHRSSIDRILVMTEAFSSSEGLILIDFYTPLTSLPLKARVACA